DFGKVHRRNADAVPLQNLLAVTYRIESARPRTNCPQTHAPQSLHDATNSQKSIEIGLETFRLWLRHMLFGQRELDAGLIQIIADRDLAAKCVAPPRHAELAQ